MIRNSHKSNKYIKATKFINKKIKKIKNLKISYSHYSERTLIFMLVIRGIVSFILLFCYIFGCHKQPVLRCLWDCLSEAVLGFFLKVHSKQAHFKEIGSSINKAQLLSTYKKLGASPPAPPNTPSVSQKYFKFSLFPR